MFKKVFIIISVILVLLIGDSVAALSRFGHQFCDDSGYSCKRISNGDSWRTLFPDYDDLDIVQKLNRTNVMLRRGMVIAIPDRLSRMDILDIAPFDQDVEPRDEKFILIDQSDLAWGAYSSDGELQAWGPISSGKNYCPDIGRGCRTKNGIFRMYSKGSKYCVSNKYPIGIGGAPMPYCMFFHGGYAMHGSPQVPGYRASHGCIRLFNRDAEWLSKHFVDLPRNGSPGTLVIIRP